MSAGHLQEDAQNGVIIISASEVSHRQAVARDLAARLGVRCTHQLEDSSTHRIFVSDDHIELCDRNMKPGRGVRVDFTAIDPRTISRREPIARAMGRGARTIIDATAGLGQDAFRLAWMGFHVTAIERSPIVAALLEDGIQRARDDDRLNAAIADRLHLIVGDARQLLPQLPRADVVYLDPMFPPKRKESALPKKQMQMLQSLLGPDADSEELFAIASTRAIKRIVVKRPTYAPPLAPHPVAIHEGKLARYDVYVPPAQVEPLRR